MRAIAVVVFTLYGVVPTFTQTVCGGEKVWEAMRKYFTTAVLVFCLVTSISASPVSSQQEHFDNRILDQKITLQLKNVTLMNALSTLSVIHRVPIGIEYSSADQNEPKLVLETESSSLNEILDSIVKHEPLYRWEARRWCYKFRARS